MYRDGDVAVGLPYLDEDVVLDWSASIGPYRGIYRGHEGAREFFRTFTDAFEEAIWEASDLTTLGNRVALSSRVAVRGAGSGVETAGRGGQVWTFAGEKVREIRMFQSPAEARRWMRSRHLDEARLYFVCEGLPRGRDPAALLAAACRGGAGVVQLREKSPRCAEELVALAEPFRRVAAEHGALFVLNDRPDLVQACGAGGVHVGQDDEPVAEARRKAGDEAIVGLSTHGPDQLSAALEADGLDRPDYVSVGPVWETPTKAGRPATGLDYVRYAAAHVNGLPWFAIGGIDSANIADVTGAGAQRVVAVREIRDADDPEAAALALREAV